MARAPRRARRNLLPLRGGKGYPLRDRGAVSLRRFRPRNLPPLLVQVAMGYVRAALGTAGSEELERTRGRPPDGRRPCRCQNLQRQFDRLAGAHPRRAGAQPEMVRGGGRSCDRKTTYAKITTGSANDPTTINRFSGSAELAKSTTPYATASAASTSKRRAAEGLSLGGGAALRSSSVHAHFYPKLCQREAR